MLIAIISDIHDNLETLKKCLTWCGNNKINSLICCGDITTLETLSYLARNFSGEIFIVSGNAEIYEEKEITKFKNLNFYGEIGINEINGINIGFCHEPEKIKKIEELSPLDLDFIFYGHTHKPWLKKRKSTLIVNPGTLGGVFYQATFAVLDSKEKNLSLKIIADL
jgi:putative phosphoesterase